MNIPELKLAIKQVEGEVEHYRHMKPALELILSACQLLCDVSDKMLPKKEKKHKLLCNLDGGNGVRCNKETCEGCKDASDWGYEYEQGDEDYNLARSEDILWLTKKMMGMDNMMEKFEPIEALPNLESARFYWKRFCIAIKRVLEDAKNGN